MAAKTQDPPKLADVAGFYVSGGRGVLLKDGTTLKEYSQLKPEHEVTQEQFDMLLRAGYIRKGIGKSPKSIFTADERPEIREHLNDRGAAPGPKGKRKAKVWNFTDDQLRGKDLDELNLLIVERGGEPRESEEEAILLLQSETE